uniref:USP domain-containing protein n=1 Tax=Scleropages formosus TaxID=113540 RepID=A0A8C9SVE2_SCLFO
MFPSGSKCKVALTAVSAVAACIVIGYVLLKYKRKGEKQTLNEEKEPKTESEESEEPKPVKICRSYFDTESEQSFEVVTGSHTRVTTLSPTPQRQIQSAMSSPEGGTSPGMDTALLNEVQSQQQMDLMQTSEPQAQPTDPSEGEKQTVSEETETKRESEESKPAKMCWPCSDTESEESFEDVVGSHTSSSTAQRQTQSAMRSLEYGNSPGMDSPLLSGVQNHQQMGLTETSEPQAQPTDPSEACAAAFTTVSTKRSSVDLKQLSGNQKTQEPELKKPKHQKNYNGLYNMGATCYLNAVLQTLFMTEEFRNRLESFAATGILKHLKTLFRNLKQGTTHVEDGLLKELGITDKFQQQDAAEYFQKILSAVGPHVSTIFRGQMKNSTKCKKHGNGSEKSDENGSEHSSFVTVPLAIDVDSHETYKVVEGWNAFFEKSVLTGDNQMYCDICDEKTDTEVSCEMEVCPEILTLHLKRFDFDYNYMTYVKNNCLVEIPLKLHDTKKHTFELYAAINHRGSLAGGHYNALIKSFEDENWYLFDDAYVTLVRPTLSYLMSFFFFYSATLVIHFSCRAQL